MIQKLFQDGARGSASLWMTEGFSASLSMTEKLFHRPKKKAIHSPTSDQKALHHRPRSSSDKKLFTTDQKDLHSGKVFTTDQKGLHF